MKIKKIFLTCWIAVLLVDGMFNLSGCGGNDPSPQEKMKSLLTAGIWTVQSVSVNGVDQSSLFKNMTITFADATYTTTNGGLVWPATGSWVFANESATAFTRNDGIDVQLTEVTSSSLKMSLVWSKNTFGPGRISSINGTHVFVMGR